MPFPEEVTPGGVLVYPSVKSPNYVTGTSGWSINVDGSAEFNNLDIRGTFNGTDYVINPLGAFFYSSTPATGNLIMSITQASGTDSFGNAYPAGFTVGSSAHTQVEMLSAGGIGGIKFLFNNAGFTSGVLDGAVGVNFAQVFIGGPNNTTAGHTDFVAMEFNSSDGTGSANWGLVYVDANAVSHLTAYGDWTGFNIPAGIIAAVDPATGTSATNAASPETWHTMPAFNTNFSHGVPVPSYKLYPDNTVGLTGQVSVVAGITAGTVVTLPSSAYFPRTAKTFPLPLSAGTPAASGNARLGVGVSGNLNLAGGPTVAAYTFNLDGIRYPLDI